MTTTALEMRPDTLAMQARGRRMLALIAALLVLPVVVSVLLWALGWQPERQINHGELLISENARPRQIGSSQSATTAGGSPGALGVESPAVSPRHRTEISGVQNVQKNAARAASDSFAPPWVVLSPGHDLLSGRWLLALAVPAECAADCVAQLQLVRRVQVALNKNMTRLQRGLIGPQLADGAQLETLRARWPDLAIGRASDATWQILGGSAIDAPQLFLIDPAGQLVLRYGADPDPNGVRRDVERLLRFSWLG